MKLLSTGASGTDKMPVTPEVKKDRIIEALNRIAARAAKLRPLIIAVEDLHWIDNSSEDCIRIMLNSMADSNVLAIFTHRPDYMPQWIDQSLYCPINLNRLTNRESRTMVTNLTGPHFRLTISSTSPSFAANSKKEMNIKNPCLFTLMFLFLCLLF